MAIQRAGFANCDRPRGHDLSCHSASNVDVVHGHAAETLDVGLAFDNHVLSRDAARDFSDLLNGHRIFALKIAPQLALNYGGPANHARAAELSLARELNVAARADSAAEAGRNLVVAQIDVCAAAGTIGRRGLVADVVFAFALETLDRAISLAAPHRFEFTVKRQFYFA